MLYDLLMTCYTSLKLTFISAFTWISALKKDLQYRQGQWVMAKLARPPECVKNAGKVRSQQVSKLWIVLILLTINNIGRTLLLRLSQNKMATSLNVFCLECSYLNQTLHISTYEVYL